MEGLHVTHKASKLAAEDVISSLPENVITNIMNRLPIRDAVKTSILARHWRLKWTLLTQLVFDCKIFQYFEKRGPKGKKYYDSSIISRLLLRIKGPVTKFFLDLFGKILHVEDFNHWVLFLSRNGIKELVLDYHHETPIKFPTHLFSCLELKHLKLRNCFIHLPLTFCGFPNLLSLKLQDVRFKTGNYGEFISRCPLLEILDIDFLDPIFEVNAFDIENLENLKKLSLPGLMFEDMVMTTSNIFLGSLPKLEDLRLNLYLSRFFFEAVARKQLSAAFPCLKTLQIDGLGFGECDMLSYAVEMILQSPNLQIVIIEAMDQDEVPPPALKLDCSRMRQLQLRHVGISDLIGSENEVCFIKWLLAYSPFLENIRIHSCSSLDSDEKLMFARKLLKLERASPVAKVVFY